jgi:hypothetical protein
MSLVIGKGFVYTTWDKMGGREYAIKSYEVDGEKRERVVYEGDVSVENISPFDYFCDPNLDNFNKRTWELVRRWENKWDLAARHPEFREEIISTDSKQYLRDSGLRFWSYKGMENSDLIPVFHFYHKRTDAMPNGRYLSFVSSKAVLFDGPIPYDDLPVDRITPGEIFDSVEGYTDMFGILPIQDAMNALISSGFTNLQAFGTQQVLVPTTANLSAEQIGKGLSILKYNPTGGEPKPLQLTAMPQGLFDMFTLLDQMSDKISGQNSVARGDADVVKGMSGTALALVQSMSVQYANIFQKSWAHLIEDGGTKIFKLLKTFAKTKRVADMVGIRGRSKLLSFSGDDLQGISRVKVELGNPLTRTTSGRVQLGQTLGEMGLITNPQEYLSVIETGNIDNMIEGQVAELDLIRNENELFMEGKGSMVRAMVGDDHIAHAREHRALVADPMIRMNEPIAAEIYAHIQMHEQLSMTQTPFWAAISNQPQMGQPQQPPMPPPGMAPPEVPLPEGAQPPAQMMDNPLIPQE